LYTTFEPFALDKWPTIINVVMDTSSITKQGYAYDFDPEYQVKYSMRTYVWVRATGSQIVTEQRDNITTVVREALLDGPSLSAYDTTVPCYPKIDEGTMREEFSELTLVKGERLLAGSFIAYELSLQETIDHTALGVVSSYDATVSTLSLLPNAPTIPQAVPGNAKVTLTWNNSTWNGGVYDITGYTIQQSLDNSSWNTVVADTGDLDPMHVITGLTNGTKYYFRVAAKNLKGVGAYSVATVAATPSA
tara:strand:- start:5276 stop:6019 length:744 start_codon:yes stop_codon:yes gene_type:complete